MENENKNLNEKENQVVNEGEQTSKKERVHIKINKWLIMGVAIAIVAISIVITCIVLSNSRNGVTGDKHVHQYKVWQVISAASCIEEGEKRSYCSCGEYITKPIAKTDHSLSWFTTQEATCLTTGVQRVFCSICEYTESVTLPIVEHVWYQNKCNVCNITKCELYGHSSFEGIYCTVCDEVLKTTEVTFEVPVVVFYYSMQMGKFENFQYELKKNKSGVYLEIAFDATKIYDDDGDMSIDPVVATYILHGSDGAIVESGMIFIDNIVLNQKKHDTIRIYLDNIDTSYKLTLADYGT